MEPLEAAQAAQAAGVWERVVEAFNTNWDSYLWFRICIVGAGIGVAWAIVKKLIFGVLWTFVRAKLSAPEAWQKKKEAAFAEKQLKAGNPVEAAEAFLRAGLHDRAIAAYAQGQQWVLAAELAGARKRTRDAATYFLRAGQDEKAAQLFADLGEFGEAEEAFRKAGKGLLIAQMYEKAGRHRQAGDWYLKGNFARQAADAYAKGNCAAEAAPLFEKMWLAGGGGSTRIVSEREQAELRKLAERAAELYVAAGQPAKAVELFDRSGRAADAGAIAEQAGEFARAGEFFRRAGEFARARACFEKAGDAKRAGVMEGEGLLQAGRTFDAAERFEAHGDLQRAAELFKSVQKPDRAAALYEKLGQLTEAAQWHCAAGNLRKGAELYEATQAWSMAERVYQQIGDTEGLLRIALRGGDHFRAAEIQRKAGNVDAAIPLYQRVERADENYTKACAALARCFHQKGAFAQAAIKFEELARREPIERSNLETYYEYGRCLEAQGNLPRALEIYNQILAHDMSYADVQVRAGAIEQKGRAVQAGGA